MVAVDPVKISVCRNNPIEALIVNEKACLDLQHEELQYQNGRPVNHKHGTVVVRKENHPSTDKRPETQSFNGPPRF